MLNKQYIRHIDNEYRDILRYQSVLAQLLRDKQAHLTPSEVLSMLSDVQSISQAAMVCLDDNCQLTYVADPSIAGRRDYVALSQGNILFEDFKEFTCYSLADSMNAVHLDKFLTTWINPAKFFVDVDFGESQSTSMTCAFNDPYLCVEDLKLREVVYLLTSILDPSFISLTLIQCSNPCETNNISCISIAS